MEGAGQMAATTFDVPDDRSNDLKLFFADPPRGVAVHSSTYTDDECSVRITFIGFSELVTYIPPQSTFADLQ